jgi:nucleotide-binding universal stress UspA family protein
MHTTEAVAMSDQVSANPRIVVGVDGSAASKAALWWAVRQAQLIDGSVDAVIAWHHPSAYGWMPPQAETYDFERIATEVLDETIAKAIGPDRWLVEIRKRVVQDNAATALLEASRGAELLVVGNRGHGGFAETLLGSVGQHCVQHATCPVVVVRGPGARPADT